MTGARTPAAVVLQRMVRQGYAPTNSFAKFIEKVDKYGMKSGIIKVVPPKEW